jgi:hypothetical protein
VIGHPRIRRPGATVGTYDCSRHGFNAAADGRIRRASHYLSSPIVDCLESGRAEAVYLLAGNTLGVSSDADRRARDVPSLLTDGLRASENHVIDEASVKF